MTQAETDRRGRFDVGEIEFVTANMECITRDYVIRTRRAAMARARRKDWPIEARERMREAADRMKQALETWPAGKFDSAIHDADDLPN